MVHTTPEIATSNLILDFEFDQHLESHKHVISIIMGFRDTGCYSGARPGRASAGGAAPASARLTGARGPARGGRRLTGRRRETARRRRGRRRGGVDGVRTARGVRTAAVGSAGDEADLTRIVSQEFLRKTILTEWFVAN
jgi:hypothetical protein